MKTEMDILVEISSLELELSQEMKKDILDNVNILRIQTQIDILKWVLDDI
jgi:hypothetical protein